MKEASHETPFSHAIESLELAAVLDFIASGCINEGAKRAIRSLWPSRDPAAIGISLREIEEMRRYRSLESDFSIGDTSCRHAIERAVRVRETLAAKELAAIASVERGILDLRPRFEKRASGYPHLRRMISSFSLHADLVRAIEDSIDKDGSIRDSASPKLRKIRRDVLSTKERIRSEAERLSRQIGDGGYATLLGTRHVLLLPRKACRKRNGIIHSTSQSGESLYFEPISLIQMNNSLESLVQDEDREIKRILRELSNGVVQISDELLENMDILDHLDGLRAKAIFSEAFEGETPAFSSDGRLRIKSGRHPLLVLSFQREGRGERVVPLDVELPKDERLMVITGPNAGGKTVTLKAVGLLALMFQCGLQVPCEEGTEFPVFGNIFADIGDEQSIESSLSTFTSHLIHLDAMCRQADDQTLCLIDEIGDGTDPDEGASLAIATLERLLSLGAAVVATTHYGKVKMFALQTPGIRNASMAFEDAENRPLFKLLLGVAGRSRGIETARRCGFDREILERAEAFLGEEASRFERLISELELSHIALEREREALSRQSESLRRVIERYAEKEREFDSSKAEQSEKARAEAEAILIHTRREIERIVKEIRESGAKKEQIRRGQERIRDLQRNLQRRERPRRAVSVSVGDVVSLSPSGIPRGTVIEVHEDSAAVEIGGKRIKTKMENLYKLDRPPESTSSGVSWNVSFEPLTSTDLDVRGQDREEALQEVDRFIDRAILSGVHEVRIIHGVGEGILLRAIQSFLLEDRRVKSMRTGSPAEGGLGVSIIQLS